MIRDMFHGDQEEIASLLKQASTRRISPGRTPKFFVNTRKNKAWWPRFMSNSHLSSGICDDCGGAERGPATTAAVAYQYFAVASIVTDHTRRDLREDKNRWRIGLPGACEHW
jgi:hypothetical protein